MLSVTVEDLGEFVVLGCVGRIVRGHEAGLLCAVLRHYERTVLLDLAKVEAIDAAGIGALISLQAAGIYLRLMDPSKEVREILRLTKVDSMLEICESGVVPSQAAEERARDVQESVPELAIHSGMEATPA
jgi:anti-anti-sigma regulatory factor